MKTVGPIKGYGITVPKQKAFQIDTPNDMIKMHTLLLAIGKRGAGKTVAVTSLLKLLKQHKVLDRLFVISPTWDSNKMAFEGLPVDEEDVFHDPTDDAILEVTKRVKQEARDLMEYKEKVSLKRRVEKALKNMQHDTDVDTIDPELLIMAYGKGVLDGEEPYHKWGGRRPVMALFIDDSVGSKMLGSRVFLNFCLRHRHIGPVDNTGLGVSVLMASQAYTTAMGGLPKAIRGTFSSLFTNETSQAFRVVERRQAV